MKNLIIFSLFILSIQTNSFGQIKYEIEERITDSTSICEKGKFKLSLIQLRYDGDSVFFEINLYEKKNNLWELTQTCRMQKDGITPLDVIIADFNNDSCNDIAIRSSIAARSSNIVRTLFIFNKTTRQLTLIKNSPDYPNLRFNRDLNCIDAWLVHGGTSTVFLKIKNDSLITFANVESYDQERTIYEVDKNGVEQIIKKEKINAIEVYDRYRNYRPLIKYKND